MDLNSLFAFPIDALRVKMADRTIITLPELLYRLAKVEISALHPKFLKHKPG